MLKGIYKTILQRVLLPILIISFVYFGYSHLHKIYADHKTFCDIHIDGIEESYYNVRKSSIATYGSTEIYFIDAEHNQKVKYAALDLQYKIICPIVEPMDNVHVLIEE